MHSLALKNHPVCYIMQTSKYTRKKADRKHLLIDFSKYLSNCFSLGKALQDISKKGPGFRRRDSFPFPVGESAPNKKNHQNNRKTNPRKAHHCVLDINSKARLIIRLILMTIKRTNTINS